MKGEATLEVGKVIGAHGLGGELRVAMHWRASRALFEAEQLWLEQEGAPGRFVIERVRESNRGLLVKLAGVDDRNGAEELRGARVRVERSEVPLEDGEYYLADLVGAVVQAPDGVVGTVERIGLHPSVDSLVIRTPEGTLVEQPLAEPWVLRVDAEAGVVELSTKDGLIG